HVLPAATRRKNGRGDCYRNQGRTRHGQAHSQPVQGRVHHVPKWHGWAEGPRMRCRTLPDTFPKLVQLSSQVIDFTSGHFLKKCPGKVRRGDRRPIRQVCAQCEPPAAGPGGVQGPTPSSPGNAAKAWTPMEMRLNT